MNVLPGLVVSPVALSGLLACLLLLLPTTVDAFKALWTKTSDNREENEIFSPYKAYKYRSLYKAPSYPVDRNTNYDWSLKNYLRTNSYSSSYQHRRPLVKYNSYSPMQEPSLSDVDEQQRVDLPPADDNMEDNSLHALIQPQPPTCSKMYCDELPCCDGMCVDVFGSNLCLLLPGNYGRR